MDLSTTKLAINMKLTTLNLWGGRVKKLEEFFDVHRDIDIWCFQEIFHGANKLSESNVRVPGLEPDLDLFKTLQSHLPDYVGEFCQTFKEVYGLATFTRSKVKIIDRGETFVHRGDWETNNDAETKDHHRKIQWLELKIDGKNLLLVNAHLTHRPQGKSDSPKRLKQSGVIVDFLAMFDCPKILVGDFNLLPETESIKMIEKTGMKNLVTEHGVTSTRTELYRRFKDGPRFADYIFVSPDIKINDFKVLPDVVSDHLPLFVDFDLH